MQGIAARCGDTTLLAKPELLRLSSNRAKALVTCYLKFQYPPMVDNINLHAYFMNIDESNELKGQTAEIVGVLWPVYEVRSM
jgi:hypothetical protein